MALFSCSFSPPSPDPQSWNKLIKKQALKGNPEQALLSYKCMQEAGVVADNFTYPILLKSVAIISHLSVGLTLHGQTIKSGFSNNPFVGTALLNMYSSFGCIDDVHKVFDNMLVKDVIAWNSVLDAYLSCGHVDNAKEVFDSMPRKDLFSYNIMVSGYAVVGRVDCARRVFDEIPVKDVVSWNSIILACCNAGDMEEAHELFEEMPEQNVVSWNTMIMGYLGNGLADDAISQFEEMRTRKFEPDQLAITAILSACAHLGSLNKGREVHIYAHECGIVSSPHVTTSLIDMYAKCGSIKSALEVFYKSQVKNIYCWNAVISALSLHGYGSASLNFYNDMRDNHERPDDVTFIALLNACSHAGLVKEGCKFFSCMERDYGVIPKMEHYGCIVDLLGRAGFLESALRLIDSMPFEPGKTVLGALLSACVNYGDLEIGEKVVKLVSERNDHLSDGEYMMVANLYASCNQWEKANRWREMMNDSTEVAKTAGVSVFEVNGRVYKFLAGIEA